MSRHRSPQGRRAHLGPPLSVVPAAAGVGGAHRSIAFPQLFTPPRVPSQRGVTSWLPVRFVATALAGGALAAAGQQALASALPVATDGANVLRLGVEELLDVNPGPGSVASLAPPVADTSPIAPVVPEPLVVDAAELVKAEGLQRAAVEAAARAVEDARVAKEEEEARVPAAEAARVADVEARISTAAATAAGGVQMVVGRVTSGFGTRAGTRHEGLDIAAPIGTPIRAPLDGRVVDSGPASGFGLWVRLEHADGTVTVYGHVNRSLVDVGQRVSAGEVIAEVGNRGQSTGPHLHLEVVTPAGTKINPRPWLDQRGIGYD